MAINTGKVVTAGLLAGLVFNAGDILINTVILAAENQAMMAKLGLDPAAMETASAMTPFIVVDFLMGILVVFNYAAIRPRFGPGARTAIIAGMIPFLAVTLVLFTFQVVGVFTMGMLVKGTLASVVNVVVGSVVGGWAYSEA
jgi:hypothetical protein